MSTKSPSDLGLGILFSVGISGHRNLLLLSSAMRAVKDSALAAGWNLAALGTGATTAVVGIGILMASVNNLKAALDLAEETAQFDYQMRHIRALGEQYGEDVSGVTDDILQMSMTYGMAATDIAEASKELIRSGRSPSEALQITPDILELALVGELSPQQATDTMLSVLNTMGLAATEAGNVTDMLAYAANQGWVTVGDFAEGFARFGAPGAAMNQSIEELIAMFIMMKNSGISSARAATMMRMMFTRLRAPSSAAATLLEDLNIDLFNADRSFRSVFDIVEDVRQAVASGIISEQQAYEAMTGEDFQQMLMQEGMDVRTIFSQRPMLGYDILTQAAKDGLVGVEVGKTLAENIKNNHEGYAQLYLNEIQDSFTFHKNQLTETWNAIKYKVGLPMLEILNEVLKTLKPVIDRAYELAKNNPELAKTAAYAALIVPLVTAVGGLILTLKGLIVVYKAVQGLAGIQAAIKGLGGLSTAASSEVPAAAAAGSSSLAGLAGTILTWAGIILGAIAITKWVIEAIKFYGNDISTFIGNWLRFQVNIIIGAANTILEIVAGLVGCVVLAFARIMEAAEWIYNALPGENVDLTGWMGDISTLADARDLILGGSQFMQTIGYLDYEIPEQWRPDSSGFYPGQARVNPLTPEDMAGIRNALNATAPREDASTVTSIKRGQEPMAGLSIGSFTINVTGGKGTPEEIGDAVVSALDSQVKRTLR